MKVIAISDMHGRLPLGLPACDLLLIAGDICPYWDHQIEHQSDWLRYVFWPWLWDQPAKHKIGVAGNHDWVFEKAPGLIPSLPWTYLQDSETTVEGLRIYGLPWQRRFCDWAFNLDTPELDKKYEAIPDGIDIIVSHGPPHGYGDWVRGGELTGSEAFIKRIDEIKPKLAVYGHIHTSPGQWTRNGSILANVTLLDDNYKMRYRYREFTL